MDGQTVFEGTVSAGTQQRWAPKQSISIRTDNGAAIEVVIDEQPVGQLGSPGQPAERVWTVGP